MPTARAHANLAFVKYWGKRDHTLNLPLNSSISMNLSAAQTLTTVQTDADLNDDEVLVDDRPAEAAFAARVSKHLDRLRERVGDERRCRVLTHNSFPASTGFASSASGLAALTVAGARAFGLQLSEKELSVLARRGSGSAARSIPDGFVEWYAAETSDDSYAASLAPPDHWRLADVAVIVATEAKRVTSSEGHTMALNSPFWNTRTEVLPGRLERVRHAILERDFDTFGREIEAEALSMHTIMMTSAHERDGVYQSGLYYWTPDTLALLIAVQDWRADGLPVYFTLDAGPTVHLMCPAAHADAVHDAVRSVGAEQLRRGDWSILVSYPAAGAALVNR